MYASQTSRRAALLVTLLSLLAVAVSLGMFLSAAAGAQQTVTNSTHDVTDDQIVYVDVEFGDGWYNGTDDTNESTSATVEIYDNSTGDLLGNQTVSVNETDYSDSTVAIYRTAEFTSDNLGIENETSVDVEILAESVSAVQSTEVTVEDESADSGGGGGILPAGSPLGTMDLIVLAVGLLIGTAVVAARRDSL